MNDALFVYMVFFSFAYVSLSAGTGALILFGAVQLTMFIVAMRGGERFTFEGCRWASAFCGGADETSLYSTKVY